MIVNRIVRGEAGRQVAALGTIVRWDRVTAILAASFACATTGGAQPSASDLDSIARRVIQQEHVVGASVLVAQRGQIVFHKGYGYADLGLEAPTKDESVYHIVGPMLPFTGIAVLQLVDAGKLSLDDDISRFIPEFPMQGHRVTVRQLLDHTSGIVDYHYLGDPIEATSRQPKGLDEVMALYAGRPWMNAPGTKWDWSISGFQLLVTTVERVSGERFADYVQRHILAPAKTTSTSYCDDFTLVRGLSHAYRMAGDAPVPAQENDMAYNADLRFCSTVSDLYRMWRAVTEVPLIKAETFARMTTATGAAARLDPKDSASRYGLAIRLNHEEGHRNIGQHGSLFGYSGSLYDFPDDQLTVVVLTNTEGQNAYAIGRALARTMLGLAQLPPRAASPPRTLADQPVTPSERQQLAGTYQLKLEQVTADLHDSYAVYRRTYRVFDENGWLMIQPLGYAPERLLKQEDGSFAIRSSPSRHITFTIAKGQATTLTMDPSPFGVTMSGKRVGKGDPVTFHRQLQ